MGIPVIGSRVSGITDILEGFEEWVFEASEVNDLIKKLQEMSKLSIEERKIIGKQMRKKVVDQYSFQNFIQTREELYIRLNKHNEAS